MNAFERQTFQRIVEAGPLPADLEAGRDRLIAMAPHAVAGLAELARSGKSESLRLRASKDLLGRVGNTAAVQRALAEAVPDALEAIRQVAMAGSNDRAKLDAGKTLLRWADFTPRSMAWSELKTDIRRLEHTVGELRPRLDAQDEQLGFLESRVARLEGGGLWETTTDEELIANELSTPESRRGE